ncbi:MAG: carbon-nitrogen hydrolase family protein [Planctomycetes bacterium]|nr:carbon-nitrogen hydrolase family protein [Planctomycetota bacterium]
MPAKVVIGVWQGRSVNAEPDANLARAAKVVDEASAAGCDFVCLPESFVSGYGSREIIERGATALDDPRLLDLARRADDRRVVTLIGITEKMDGGELGNTVVVLDDGRILGVYRKVMLTDGDAQTMRFCAGRAFPLFTARGVRFGVQICHDSSYPEIASLYRFKGAQVLFSPHYNNIEKARMDEHRVRVRNNHAGSAVHFNLVVARSNVIVTDDPEHLGYGDSAIYDPEGRPIAEAGLFTERLIQADVGRWLVPDARPDYRDKLAPHLIEAWAEAARAATRRT